MHWTTHIGLIVAYFAVRYFFKNWISARRGGNSSGPATGHGKVIEVDNPAVFKALTSTGPVVVDFFATWCGPCKAIAPRVGQLSETYANVRFIQVDVDKVRPVAQELQVRAMPTFCFYQDGQLLEKRVVGGNVKELEEQIKTMVA